MIVNLQGRKVKFLNLCDMTYDISQILSPTCQIFVTAITQMQKKIHLFSIESFKLKTHDHVNFRFLTLPFAQ